MGKANCVIEIMSEYLRKREIIYFFKVASALKPYVVGRDRFSVQESNPTAPVIPLCTGGQGGFCSSLSFANMTQDVRRD